MYKILVRSRNNKKWIEIAESPSTDVMSNVMLGFYKNSNNYFDKIKIIEEIPAESIKILETDLRKRK